jgi:hypothetical protein
VRDLSVEEWVCSCGVGDGDGDGDFEGFFMIVRR